MLVPWRISLSYRTFFSCVVQDGEAHRNALELLDALLGFFRDFSREIFVLW